MQCVGQKYNQKEVLVFSETFVRKNKWFKTTLNGFNLSAFDLKRADSDGTALEFFCLFGPLHWQVSSRRSALMRQAVFLSVQVARWPLSSAFAHSNLSRTTTERLRPGEEAFRRK